ncbi:MAG TPA: cobalamin-binding protein [Longimicrobium sp.]|nr:cobalamin-binding protein [Longimicrobium sp.]
MRPTRTLPLLPLLLFASACREARTGAPPPPSEASAPIVVTDDAGREVRLTKPAERVVSLLPHVTDFIVAMGAAGRLAARTEYDTAAAVAGLPSVGGGLSPSLETLVALRPDLVIVWPGESSRDLTARLTALGISVYGARQNRLEGTGPVLERLGRLLGTEAAADSIARAIDGELRAVRASVAGRPHPSVLFVISRDPLMAAGGTTFIHDVVTAAGGRNAFGELQAPAPQVSLEEVVRRDPDVILFPDGEHATSALEWLRSRPGWSELEAVREGRVLEVDGELFGRPGPRIGTAVRTLARWLHPEAFEGAADA